jgi:hypothetical protein
VVYCGIDTVAFEGFCQGTPGGSPASTAWCHAQLPGSMGRLRLAAIFRPLGNRGRCCPS